MGASPADRSLRRRGYRAAVLTDPRGRVLAYVDRLAVHPAATGGGSVGLSGVMFAPSVLERLGKRAIPRVRVVSAGTPRLELWGLGITFDDGRAPAPHGGWHCEAAVGTFRKLVSARARV